LVSIIKNFRFRKGIFCVDINDTIKKKIFIPSKINVKLFLIDEIIYFFLFTVKILLNKLLNEA